MRHTLLTLLFLPASFTVSAQNWTGAVDSDWNNPANWSATPADGNTLIIDPANYTGAMADPVVSGVSDFIPAEVNAQNGAQLTINGTLEVTDELRIGNNSWLFMQGALTISEGDLVVEGGNVNITTGLLEVARVLTISDGANGTVFTTATLEAQKIVIEGGQSDIPSYLGLSGGTITTDTLHFSNETADFEPLFRLTTGNLTINHHLASVSAAPDAGRGYFRQMGGEVHMTGMIGNAVPGTMNLKLEISLLFGVTGIFYNSASQVYLADGDSLLMHSDGRWLEEGTVSWENNGVFLSDGWGLFRTGNTTLTGTGFYQFGTLFVSEGKTLDHVSPYDIRIVGDFNVNGTFIPNENRVIFNASYAGQVVLGPDEGITFYDIFINNNSPAYDTYGGTVSLQPDATIENSMVLVDGIVTCPGTLSFPDDATLTGGSDSTYIDGEILKTGNNAFTFALGKRSNSTPTFYGERYRPLIMTAPATPTTAMRVSYHFSAPEISSVNDPLESISQIEYWKLSRTGSTDLVGISVGWDHAASSGLNDCDEISLAYRETGTQEWTAVPSTASGLCSGEDAGMLTSTGNLPEYSAVTIGFTTNTVHQQAVSVCYGDSYTINGNVYDSSGVYVDELEAANGGDSTVVTILTVRNPLYMNVGYNPDHLFASGPPDLELTYQWINCDSNNAVIPGETGVYFFPTHPGNYAVIAYSPECDETDTSQCVEMLYAGLEEQTPINLQVYPNPVISGGQLLLKTSAELAQLEVRSLDGRVVVQEEKLVAQDDKIVVNLPQLPAGTYLLTGQTASGQRSVVRFMVSN